MTTRDERTHLPTRRGRWAMWSAGLLVALGAAATTAHGLYEVARAAGTPAGIAWLYPLITDGLALVAYASSARLTGSARQYAWSVVVLAAGLSGLAQASFLAGGVAVAPPPLRFGVGAWPAVAAAIAAHLLFLLGTARLDTIHIDTDGSASPIWGSNRPLAHRDDPGVQLPGAEDVHPSSHPLPAQPRPNGSAPRSGGMAKAFSPRDRARTVAELCRRESGALPTVRELASLADVSRGTAANALEELRNPAPTLRMLTDQPDEGAQP